MASSSSEMITAATERFERRLVEEIAAVRVQVAQVEVSVRDELGKAEVRLHGELAQVRIDMGRLEAGLRQEITGSAAALRQEIAASEGRLRQEMATGRVELLKWSFLFWIGQVLALAGFFAFAIRAVRP